MTGWCASVVGRVYMVSGLTVWLLCWAGAVEGLRVKRQDEDEAEEGEQTAEELCKDRPPDEYFRLTTSGDCRDVVR